MEIEHLFRSTALAVGLKPSARERLKSVTSLLPAIVLAVGLKPSASRGEARLSGL